VIDHAELDLAGTIAVGNDLMLNSPGNAIENVSGDNQVDGAVTLGRDTTIDLASGSSLLLGNTIDDGGSNSSLIQTGSSTLMLSGSNAYSGGTRVQGGTLRVFSNSATGTSGTVVIGAAATQRSSAVTYTLPPGGLQLRRFADGEPPSVHAQRGRYADGECAG
jgi:autotransporter-associated beta strand protein